MSSSKDEPLQPDLGNDRLLSIAAVVSARRNARKDETKAGFFQRIIGSKNISSDRLKQYLHSNLTSLKMNGILPMDFVEQQVSFQSLRHSVDSMIDFGFTWDHMMRMGLNAEGLQKFQFHHFKQLKIKSNDILNTCPSIHDILSLQMTPQQLHELGFTWTQLEEIGANEDILPFNKRDINVYFGKQNRPAVQPTQQPRSSGKSKKFKF